MENSTSVFPDWANLPLAVVHLISEKVKSLTDYVRFRAVCSPWRSASLPKPRHLPHQLPWLMIPYSDCIEDDGIRLFYDLWQSKMHKIHLPETIYKRCCASYLGWLLLVAPKGTELFLLNPVTRTRVELPPFTTPVRHIWDQGILPPRKVDFLFNSFMGNSVITKITFSADLADPNCLIMVFFQRSRGIFFCQVGDCCWTEVVLDLRPSPELADAAYSNGRFYLLHEGAISIYDGNPNKVQSIYLFEPELCPESMYFLEGKSVLCIVAVHYIEEEGEEAEEFGVKTCKQKLELYQVQEQRMEVKQIADTSDTTIFNGVNYHYLAVRTDDWDSLNGGCMYDVIASSAGNDGGELCYSIYFVKLDDGNPEPVVLDLAEKPPIWPSVPAMWYQPSFV